MKLLVVLNAKMVSWAGSVGSVGAGSSLVQTLVASRHRARALPLSRCTLYNTSKITENRLCVLIHMVLQFFFVWQMND